MIKTADFVDQYKKGKVPASTLIKMAAFKNELETSLNQPAVEGLMKIAAVFPKGFGELFKHDLKSHLIQGVAGMPAMLAGSLVVSGGLMLFMEAVKALEGKIVDWSNEFHKPKLFKEMLTLHPALKEYDTKLVETYYEALWHFSPVMAENPLAAGAYIRQALTMHHVAGGPLPNSINEVTSIQKNWNQGTKDDSDSMMTTIMTPFKSSIPGVSKQDK